MRSRVLLASREAFAGAEVMPARTVLFALPAVVSGINSLRLFRGKYGHGYEQNWARNAVLQALFRHVFLVTL